MGFLKKFIGSEPTVSRFLGQYDKRTEHNLNTPDRSEMLVTNFYLHTYSTNKFKIEIISEREVPSFSFFSDVTPKIERRLFDLQSDPTNEEGGITKFVLAEPKVNLRGVVLLLSAESAVLIFPSKLTYTYTIGK